MKASYWRVVAIAIFMVGILGGCQGSRIAQLEEDLAAVTKERDEIKAERDTLDGTVTRLQDEARVAQITSNQEIDRLKKEIEELQAKLPAQ